MSITIKNAILHILRNDGRPSVYSESELDIDSEVCEAFIAKHVKKLCTSPSAREAYFKPEAALYEKLGHYTSGSATFKETAEAIAKRLSEILVKHVDIPPADLLIVRFEDKKASYLAVLKLNYLECYTHETHDSNADNQLVKCHAVLPFNNGKVEEACLITLGGGNDDGLRGRPSAMTLRIMEKPYIIDGEAVCYFSQLFLECETALSKKETAQLIGEITDEFVQEYYNNDLKASAMLKTAIVEEAEEDEGFISMENVAAKVFEENEEVKQQYVETLREAGIRADVPLGAKFTRQQFGTQRIKAENGVELKFPAELAADEGEMEITNHSDGTVTIVLKRMRPV